MSICILPRCWNPHKRESQQAACIGPYPFGGVPSEDVPFLWYHYDNAVFRIRQGAEALYYNNEPVASSFLATMDGPNPPCCPSTTMSFLTSVTDIGGVPNPGEILAEVDVITTDPLDYRQRYGTSPPGLPITGTNWLAYEYSTCGRQRLFIFQAIYRGGFPPDPPRDLTYLIALFGS